MSVNTTQKKHKFNVIDAVILVVICAVVAAAAFLLGSRNAQSEQNSVTLEYIVEFRTIRDEFVDNINVGVKLVDASKKYSLGDVVAVTSKTATFIGTDFTSGQLVYGDYPDHSDVQITVRSNAVINDSGRYVIDGGYEMSVGATVYARMPDYTGTGYCTQIKEIKD
ncbi:MAG: DUF4330 family protein [Clostridia bacterium]|nr:DUF4330 family protein [Clostridia bacterium]